MFMFTTSHDHYGGKRKGGVFGFCEVTKDRQEHGHSILINE